MINKNILNQIQSDLEGNGNPILRVLGESPRNANRLFASSWKNISDQMYSCRRDYSISRYHRDQSWAPLKHTSDHHSTIVLRGLRRALN